MQCQVVRVLSCHDFFASCHAETKILGHLENYFQDFESPRNTFSSERHFQNVDHLEESSQVVDDFEIYVQILDHSENIFSEY